MPMENHRYLVRAFQILICDIRPVDQVIVVRLNFYNTPTKMGSSLSRLASFGGAMLPIRRFANMDTFILHVPRVAAPF